MRENCPCESPADDEPLYLGCSLKTWLEMFAAAETIDEEDRTWLGMVNFGEPFLRHAVALLDSIDSRRQSLLLRCMANVGRQSVPYLTHVMSHSAIHVRTAACKALAEALNTDMEEPAYTASIIKMLRDFFDGPKLLPAQRQTFFDRLDEELAAIQSDKAVSAEVYAALTANLDGDDDGLRIAAIETLEQIGFSADLIPSMFRILLYVLKHDGNDHVREIAARLLASEAIAEHPAFLQEHDLTCLLTILDDVNPVVRGEVASLLERLYKNGIINLDAFMQPVGEVKLRLGPRATCELFAMIPELVPALFLKLHDSHAETRIYAAIALGRASKHLGWTKGRRKEAVSALAQLLDDSDSAVRMVAIQALTHLKSPTSLDVDAALAKATEDSVPTVRREASNAIRCLSGDMSVRDAEGDEDDEEDSEDIFFHKSMPLPECVYAAETRCHELATAPACQLETALHDRDIAIRIAAVEALRETDGTDHKAIDNLFHAIQDPCFCVRHAAQRTLRWASIRLAQTWHGQCQSRGT